MKKIGADNRVPGVNMMQDQHTQIFDMFLKHAKVVYPWLDAGTGDSWNRQRMKEIVRRDGNTLYTSEVDLDVRRYDFPDGFFNTITSFELLEHLYNPLFHLIELHRVLSSTGNLFLDTPNDYSLIHKAEHLLSRKYRPHFHQFCERDLRDILERAGFIIVDLRKFHKSRSGTIARISRNGLWVHAKKSQKPS